VATDVAARGVHVDEVELVVHVDPPVEHKAYLHRSGRTARAGASGTIISLVQPDQERAVKRMQRTLDLPMGLTTPAPLTVRASAPPQPEPAAAVTRERPVPVVRDVTEVRGRIKFYDTKRGFGFIARTGEADLFVHHTALDVPGHRLTEGQPVAFGVVPGRRGDEARRVRLLAA
jgi:superfamily II DNA/RNA helicase